MSPTTNRVALSELISIKHGFAFRGEDITSVKHPHFLVTPGNFQVGGGFKLGKLKYFSGDVPAAYVLREGDLVVTMTDLSKNTDTLGFAATIPRLPSGLTALHNQRIGLIEIKSQHLDRRWLEYRLRAADYRAEVIASSTGTTVHHTSPGRILAFELELPPLGEQRAIAATLGALDDKIESNRRAIAKAQELGDALFRSASVEYRAVSDVAVITMGSSPRGETLNEVGEGVPFYQGARDFSDRFPSLRVWTDSPVRLAKKNDTLMSVRAPVGELNRAPFDCCVGRGVAAIHSETQPSTLYYAMRASTSTWDKFQGEGTVFASVNKKDVHDSEILWVSDGSAEALELTLSALDDRIESLDHEVQHLSRLRDALLPELLSGRTRISAEGGGV